MSPTPETQHTPVPFVDLPAQNGQVAEAVAAGFGEVLADGRFVLGPAVTAFERAFAAFCGVGHCVGVGNGTDAIELALRALDVGHGDEVVIPTNTFVATAEAVLRAGARVVLADVDDDLLLDPGSALGRVTARTRAVVGVHLYGQPAPMEQLRAVLPDRTVLIEDAAQSQGAARHGVRSGALGDVAATSFYPGKNLGAYGDAGGVTTGSVEVADRVRALANHGGVRKYQHDLIGLNSRMDALQAVVLAAKLERLEQWNKQRQDAADRYRDLLGDLPGLALPTVAGGNEHVWHLYVVQTDHRDRIAEALAAAGIGTGVHYPQPVHLLPAYRFLGHDEGDFPVAERAAHRILSLPMFPGITASQQGRVAEVLTRELRRC